MFYLVRTGCQWRMLPKDYPKWKLVIIIIADGGYQGELAENVRNTFGYVLQAVDALNLDKVFPLIISVAPTVTIPVRYKILLYAYYIQCLFLPQDSSGFTGESFMCRSKKAI